jgi:porin
MTCCELMTRLRAALPVIIVAMSVSAHAQPAPEDPGWLAGDHLTGEWGGARRDLADRGLTIDLFYTAEIFGSSAHPAGGHATEELGHVDLALTVDTHKLGLWRGGTFYILGQNNHGTGINALVGSATQISNLEADPYTQITELFLEQALFADKLRIRIGKQDANRDFGTPRFGGNFLNNNFGMFPTAPLPSYPTTGLGAAVIGQPLEWLAVKAALYEGNPTVGSLGFDTAFQHGAGYMLASSISATHHYGAAHRDGGTTSVGAWHQTGTFPDLDADDPPRTFESDDGVFIQEDERIYAHPSDATDPRGLTVILRASGSRSDRTAIAHYLGGSAAWHGLGGRRDDTVGLGFGDFTVTQPLGGARGQGTGGELFVEAFYKARLTSFVSLQPDVELYRHPGGDGADALLIGCRLRLKL